LLNVGKLFVPSDVLTKSGALDQEERGQLSSGSEKWLSLLSNVPFDLPIAPTLAQAHALMQGRCGVAETSSLAARVIVVANGFVALVSPRTYREPNSSEDAIVLLAGLPSMDAQIVDALSDITFR
jgi:HD-GYP domain-containing protein (c-di-GMP phosphodiesterase class II)